MSRCALQNCAHFHTQRSTVQNDYPFSIDLQQFQENNCEDMTAEEKDHSESKTVCEFLCDDNWGWDYYHRSSEVDISGFHSEVAVFHRLWSTSTAAVRGTRVLNGGRFYWELVLAEKLFGTSIMFGIGTDKAALHKDRFINNIIGRDEHSWGISHKGLKCHNGKKSFYTVPFRENIFTRVGMYFDGIAGTLTYYKDGKCLGVAFTGLNYVKESLYPMVSSTAAKTEIVLENMKRDFMNLQDRCRYVIARRIRTEDNLCELGLPPRLKSYVAEVMPDTYQSMGKYIYVN